MERKKINKTISIDSELWSNLERVAKREGKSISELIRIFCAHGVKQVESAQVPTLLERLVG